MKISYVFFLLVLLASFEAKRILKACKGCPSGVIIPSTTTSTTGSTTSTPTTSTSGTTSTTTTTPSTSTTTTPSTTTSTSTTTPSTTTTTTTSTTTPSTSGASSTTGATNTYSISGLGPAGNPAGMNTATFVENVDIPAGALACSSSRFTPSSTGIWSFAQIADAFYEYSVKPWNFPNPTDRSKHVSECVAALVIAAGECSTPVGAVGCSTASGPSGVWQTDFLRTIPGFPTQPVMSLCLSAFGAGYMAAPFVAGAGKSCTVSVNGGAAASIFTCYDAPATVNGYGTTCADPQGVSGVTYTNFIGPFCHKAWASRWSSCPPGGAGCCALFNGGGNSYQTPFPQYYFDMSNTQGGTNFLSICQQAALLPPVS